MRLVLSRFASDAQSTLGRLSIDTGVFSCFTLEDEARAVKLMHETRIPKGTYRLRLKPLGSSRFDDGYLKRFGVGFHRGMIELMDVPGFTGVLIHIGNFESDTSGCILVGMGHVLDARGYHSVTQSAEAYRRLYPLLRDALLAGDDVTIEIREMPNVAGASAGN